MQTRFFPVVLSLFMVLGLTLHHQPSWAGRVIKVKGKKVYIKLSNKEADNLSKGDKLYLISKESRKKKGVVVIRKIKGKKAIAKLKKGKAKRKYRTRMAGKRKKYKDSIDVATDIADAEVDTEHSDIMMGFMGNFTMMEQNIDGEDVLPVDLTGAMTGVKAILDYSLTESFGLRIRAGMDMMNVSGTDENDNTTTMKINYLTLDILGRYYLFRTKKFGFSLIGGAGIYSPLSDEVTADPGEPALDKDSISTTSLGIVGVNLHYSFGNWQIFVGGDYFYFPPSETVTTNAFGGKLGILFPF